MDLTREKPEILNKRPGAYSRIYGIEKLCRRTSVFGGGVWAHFPQQRLLIEPT